MSKIEELIEKLCPDGVEYKKIGDYIVFEQPTNYIVKSTDYDNSYKIPVLTAGQSFILGYTNENFGIYKASKNNPVIIFDDFTGTFKWVDFDFKVKSSAIKMLKAKSNLILLRYFYHYMGSKNFISTEHKRLWIGIYSEFEFPVPPLEIQREIVQILDNFTELTAELTAELQARRKQYEFYRDKLLTFEEPKIEWKTLNQISQNLDYKRKPITGENREKGNIPYYGASGIVDYVQNYIFDETLLLISEDGANLIARNTPIAFTASGKSWVNNHAHVLKFNNINTHKFVEYYLNSIDLSKYISGAAQPKLNQENLNKIPIPFPPLEIQERIVNVLDNFDKICSDLGIGLPAEIEARQKQFEYYREKLLTFKNGSATIFTDRQTDRAN